MLNIIGIFKILRDCEGLNEPPKGEMVAEGDVRRVMIFVSLDFGSAKFLISVDFDTGSKTKMCRYTKIELSQLLLSRKLS